MRYETIDYTQEGQVGILTYNRPRLVNAVNTQMVHELIAFWRDRQSGADVRVILTRGAGEKGFCSGADLKEAASLEEKPGGLTHEEMYSMQSRFSQVYALMRSCPQPIIAAVHGPALGGGLCLALASDIRLASPDAMFCAQFVNIGVGGADMGSSYFLWRIVGWGKAAEMCLTGVAIHAEEALRIGLVNHIYPKEELFSKALAMGQAMALKSAMVLRLTKETLNSALNATSLNDALEMENRNQTLLAMCGKLRTDIRAGR